MTTPVSSVGSTDPTAAASGSSAVSSSTSSLLDPTTFLTMLVDELKYQNPLNPTSSSDFMSQIAQLSQVEQLQTMSTASQMGEAANLIGKSVTANLGDKELTGTVTGITNTTNGPMVDVDGTSVSLSDIGTISSPSSSGS